MIITMQQAKTLFSRGNLIFQIGKVRFTFHFNKAIVRYFFKKEKLLSIAKKKGELETLIDIADGGSIFLPVECHTFNPSNKKRVVRQTYLILPLSEGVTEITDVDDMM